MNKAVLTRINAVREAGTVRRCHIIPHHGLYNIAQHSYGAASLLLLLHPCPSRDLIKAVLWHDVGERWLGDMPNPGKSLSLSLREAYEHLEASILQRLGLLPDLTEEEQQWLRAVDTLDLWLWCREEEALGNKAVANMRRACEKATEERWRDGTLPILAWNFYAVVKLRPHERMSDFFEEVMRDGLGEAEERLGD